MNIALELRLKCRALAISCALRKSAVCCRWWWVGGSEQQFTVTLRHVDSYVLLAAPTCHLPPALHKLANNVEQSGSRAALLRWWRRWGRLAVFLLLLSLLPPFTAFCTCVMHFHAIYNSFPKLNAEIGQQQVAAQVNVL